MVIGLDRASLAVYRHFPAPRPSYVAPWHQLPSWQRETDGDIFEAIERLAVSA